jgi:general secretion pathway protein D
MSRSSKVSSFLTVIFMSFALAAQAGDTRINFSFDQVEVRSFVKLVGDITGKKFVLGEDVSGKITVVSPQVSREEVYPLFVSILETAGCSVVDDGDIIRIVKLPPRDAQIARVVGVEEKLPESGITTKVISLKNVSAVQVKKVLEPHIRGGKLGAVAALEESNHLVITDTVENIKRVEKIISEVDAPGAARVTEIVQLKFASAEDLADQLNAAVAETASRADRLKQRLPSVPGEAEAGRRMSVVVPAPHANSLMLVGSPSQVEELKKIIERMDIDVPSGRGRLNAIFMKYISAEQAAKSLNALLGRTVVSNGTAATPSALGQEIAIEAMVENNALLVDAMPGDFEVLNKLIGQLDQIPQQVHISVLIAQQSNSDGLELGVDMAALDVPGTIGSTVVQGSSTLNENTENLMNAIQGGVFPRGLTVGVAYGTRLDAEGKMVPSYPAFLNIDAVKKSGHFKILSESSLTQQNNIEAELNVVDEIPILKSTISGGTGTARDIIENIERVDVGIKLKLTPHIIPGGDVKMSLNPSIEAVVDQGPAGTAFAPTIAKRSVSTTVTVPDGKMIVIAGLTRQDKIVSEKRVPFLGAIPIIGRLFRHTSEKEEQSNLLIFVTPRIVTDIASAQAVLQDWEKKTGLSPNERDKK